MNDKVGEVIARQDEFSAEFGETRSEEVENTDGQAVPVTSNSEKWALAHGISALFELAASHEKRIAELETRLNGLLGMGGGLDTALAKRDARIEAQALRLGALEYSVDQVHDEVVDPLAEWLAELIAASKATSEPAAAPVQQEAATAPENCEQAGRDILGKALRISDLAREAQGEWRSVTYTEAPGWTRPLKTICDLASEIEVDALDLID